MDIYRLFATSKHMQATTAIATLSKPMPLGTMLLHALSADSYRASYYCYGYYYRCSAALSQVIRKILYRH